ncbi:hypothetical protein DFJ58DRAFT_773598, partial [Suillus subalutaceus]|uniref:uncharacterized protein n=1 Tax=Suillus subalutaceus TaxID=48586 RepID=UPI001B872EF7
MEIWTRSSHPHSLTRNHFLAFMPAPLIPMGMPHRTTEVVVFEDYRVPAVTTVFGNHCHFRAISRDPDVFPDPDASKPDRWLDTEGRVRDDLKLVWGAELIRFSSAGYNRQNWQNSRRHADYVYDIPNDDINVAS